MELISGLSQMVLDLLDVMEEIFSAVSGVMMLGISILIMFFRTPLLTFTLGT